MNQNLSDLPHVVVIGGGFGGLETARGLNGAPVRVTLIDRHNYHLFQPLLYQVATGGLSPANIATPLRSILRKQTNCETLMAEAVGFNLEKKEVILADDRVDFDYLVVAVGATHSYFGNEEWSKLAPGLKTITDATSIRRRIYMAFEAAERETNPEIRKQWMHFVIVGAGPTGVELAGAISEIAFHTLRSDFRNINPDDAKITIVQSGPTVLQGYPEDLSEKAAKMIRSLKIEIMTGHRVTEITDNHVVMSSEQGGTSQIETRTVLWGAGVKANPLSNILAEALDVSTDRAGRISVNSDLRVPDHDNLFVIGDMAVCQDADGKSLPGLAAVASQQGKYVANAIKSIRATETGHAKPAIEPFQYSDRGSMATIGRARAIAYVKGRKFAGLFAWFLWLFVHLLLLVQFQNRLLVFFQWVWNYLTFSRSARLIIGDEHVKIVHTESQTQSSVGELLEDVG